MTNLATGKAFTRRDFGKGLAAIFASGVAPALLGQTARGLMHRNLGGRIATIFQKGEYMTIIKAQSYMHTCAEVYAWLISLGYTTNSPYFFVRKSIVKRDRNRAYNQFPIVIFPNYNGVGKFGVLTCGNAKTFGTGSCGTIYLDSSSSTTCYINEGDEYYVITIQTAD